MKKNGQIHEGKPDLILDLKNYQWTFIKIFFHMLTMNKAE
jgi:hypothetical protein